MILIPVPIIIYSACIIATKLRSNGVANLSVSQVYGQYNVQLLEFKHSYSISQQLFRDKSRVGPHFRSGSWNSSNNEHSFNDRFYIRKYLMCIFIKKVVFFQTSAAYCYKKPSGAKY